MTWIEVLKRAKEVYDAGESTFVVNCLLEETTDFYNQEKEDEEYRMEKEKKK
jgi:hypothetical protein